jgi:protein-S-isoprenylcysteine O-methyltransferase Ste14
MRLDQVAPLALVSRILVAVGWAGFFVFFFGRAKPARGGVTKRAPVSWLGIVLQMVGYSLVWMLQRRPPAAGTPLSAAEVALDVLAPVVSALSAWMGLAAVRTLGRQWSYTARLVQEHKLVTEGPYGLVRHPIYTAMFGKLLATNFAFGHWIGLPVAGSIFVIGTLIRIRSEERLLREAFGPEFEAYARRVPAFIPLAGGRG